MKRREIGIGDLSLIVRLAVVTVWHCTFLVLVKV